MGGDYGEGEVGGLCRAINTTTTVGFEIHEGTIFSVEWDDQVHRTADSAVLFGELLWRVCLIFLNG